MSGTAVTASSADVARSSGAFVSVTSGGVGRVTHPNAVRMVMSAITAQRSLAVLFILQMTFRVVCRTIRHGIKVHYIF